MVMQTQVIKRIMENMNLISKYQYLYNIYINYFNKTILI